MLSLTNSNKRCAVSKTTLTKILIMTLIMTLMTVIILQLHAIYMWSTHAIIGQMSITIHDLFAEPLVIKPGKDFFFHKVINSDTTHRAAINVQIQEEDPFLYHTDIPLLNKTHFDIETTIQTHFDVAKISVNHQNQPVTVVNDTYTFRLKHASNQTPHATFVSFQVQARIAQQEVIIDVYFYALKQPDTQLQNWNDINKEILHKNEFWRRPVYSNDRAQLDPHEIIPELVFSKILFVQRDELAVDRIIDTVRRKQSHYPFWAVNVGFIGEIPIDMGGPSQDYLDTMMQNVFAAIGSHQFMQSGLVLHNTSVDDVRTVIEAMAMCLYTVEITPMNYLHDVSL
eukprot:705493_1